MERIKFLATKDAIKLNTYDQNALYGREVDAIGTHSYLILTLHNNEIFIRGIGTNELICIVPMDNVRYYLPYDEK